MENSNPSQLQHDCARFLVHLLKRKGQNLKILCGKKRTWLCQPPSFHFMIWDSILAVFLTLALSVQHTRSCLTGSSFPKLLISEAGFECSLVYLVARWAGTWLSVHCFILIKKTQLKNSRNKNILGQDLLEIIWLLGFFFCCCFY